MLEEHLAELLATYLSRFIENVNPTQLQVSLWSGKIVLHNVHLRKDFLEQIAVLWRGEAVAHAQSTAGASKDVSRSSPRARSPADNGGTSPMPMLLAPFTLVSGVIRQLSILVPWTSLESEAVRIEIIGVDLTFGPLRARPYNAWEEQEREARVKQQQLSKYEEERLRVALDLRGDGDSTASTVSSGVPEDRRRGQHEAATGPDGKTVSPASWFKWFWDFDRINQLALRNVSLLIQTLSVRYEFDYEGLHPDCAAALCVFVRQAKLTTTDEFFEETFDSDVLSAMCKKLELDGVVVSVHAERQERAAVPSGEAAEERSTRMQTPALDFERMEAESEASLPVSKGSQKSMSAWEHYQLQWKYSKAALEVRELALRVKLVPPDCISTNPIADDMPRLSASLAEVTAAVAGAVEVDSCFGVAQVLISLWRSYQQSLPCAKYRKRLLLLRTTREEAGTGLGASRDVDRLRFIINNGRDTTGLVRPSAQRRWIFALRCILDDIRERRQVFGSHERSRREEVEAMVKFGQLRKVYCPYWKRTKGLAWAPPLDSLEKRKLVLMEHQLSLPQAIFLRCLAYAEISQDQENYDRQQAFIEQARLRSKVSGGGGSQSLSSIGQSASSWWGWLSRGAPAASLSEGAVDTPPPLNAFISSDCPQQASALPVLDAMRQSPVAFADIVSQEWEVGRRFINPQSAPFTLPSLRRNRLVNLAAESTAYFTLRVLMPDLRARLNPIYWPLQTHSRGPAVPSDTPLQWIDQHLLVQLHALELFYTTVPSDKQDKTSLSFFVRSAAVSFEGGLSSSLLQSKERTGEDYVVVKVNARRTHMCVFFSPQLVVCQPLHEWSWWANELFAFSRVWSGEQHDFCTLGESRTCDAIAAAQHAPSVEGWSSLSQRQTAASSLAVSASESQCGSLQRGRARLSLPPLMVTAVFQTIDVCVPLFARDIGGSDLDILDQAPITLPCPGTTVPRSVTAMRDCGSYYSDRGQQATRKTMPGGLGSEEGPLGSAGGSCQLRSKDNCARSNVEYITDDDDEDEVATSSCTSQGNRLSSCGYSRPQRLFLNGQPCLVLTISTTRLCTVSPPTKRYKGPGTEYYLCVGDLDQAVRLFFQTGAMPGALLHGHQLGLLSFVAGEMLLNPLELTVSFSRGIDAVLEPEALAAINDGLLKPLVFGSTEDDSKRMEAIAVELRLAKQRAAARLESRPPWRFTSSSSVKLLSEEETDVCSFTLPKDSARYMIMRLQSTLPESVSFDKAQGSDESSTPILGFRSVTLGVSVVRLLIRSASRTDLAELVMMAPEHMPPGISRYRRVLAALVTEEPRAVELFWRTAPAVKSGINFYPPDEPVLTLDSRETLPSFLLSMPDITMTTATGMKLLTAENFALVQGDGHQKTSEISLMVDAVSIFFDLAIVHVLEVACGVVGSLRPMQPLRQPIACPTPSLSNSSDTSPYILSSVPFRCVVRKTILQVPVNESIIHDSPYVEIKATVEDFLCTYTLLDHVGSKDNLGDACGQQLHVHFNVPKVVQSADYVGGDPNVRQLVSSYPWAAHCGIIPKRPLRFFADVTVSKATGASSVSSVNCSAGLAGGAFHVYCPFLYLYMSSVYTDLRLARLCALSQSPLLQRGFSQFQKVQRRDPANAFVGHNAACPSTAAAEPSPLSVSAELVLSNLDILLATDAATPIDMHHPDTLCALHIENVTAGYHQHATHRSAEPTTKYRTSLHVDTKGWQVVDFFASPSQWTHLPYVKLRMEKGFLLTPKENLTGYAYERADVEDWAVLLGIHPSASECSSPLTASQRAFPRVLPDAEEQIVVKLSGYQCRCLTGFFVRNAARPAIVSAGHAQKRQSAASLSVYSRDSLECVSSVGGAIPTSTGEPPSVLKGVTILITIPPVSLLISEVDACDKEGSRRRTSQGAHTPMSPSYVQVVTSEPTAYVELSLRRGAYLYFASGDRWSSSPMQNAQISGLDVLIHQVVGEMRTEAERGACGDSTTFRTHPLLTIDLIGVTLLNLYSPRDADELINREEETRVLKKLIVSMRDVHIHVPELIWWLALYQFYSDIIAVGEGISLSPMLSGSLPPASRNDSNISEGFAVHGLSGFPLVTSSEGDANEKKMTGWNAFAEKELPSCETRRLAISFEVSRARVSLFNREVGEKKGALEQKQTSEKQPLCQLFIPEARLTVSPLPASALTEGSPVFNEYEQMYEECILELTRCPDVRLLVVQGSTNGSIAGTTKTAAAEYVSVLRLQAHQGDSEGAAGTGSTVLHPSLLPLRSSTPSQYESSSCFFLRLIRATSSLSVPPLRYGQSFPAQEIALQCSSHVRARLQHVAFCFPAPALFSFAQELHSQVQQLDTLAPVSAPIPVPVPTGPSVEGPVHAHMAVEAEIENVEVRIGLLPTSPDGYSATAKVVTEGGVLWNAAVRSATIATSTELRNVQPRTGNSAIMADGTSFSERRMRMWRLIHHVKLDGLVFTTGDKDKIRWILPVLELTIAHPLPKTIFYMRSSRTYGDGDEERGEPPTLAESRELNRSCMGSSYLFVTEPTMTHQSDELNCHALTTLSIDFGEGLDQGDGSAAPVVFHIPTIHAVASATVQLWTCWKQVWLSMAAFHHQGSQGKVATAPPTLPRLSEDRQGLTTCYEGRLRFCGRVLDLVGLSPRPRGDDSTTEETALRITLDGAVVAEMDGAWWRSEEGFPSGMQTTPSVKAVTEGGITKEMKSHGKMHVQAPLRVRTKSFSIRDLAGNLIMEVAESGAANGEEVALRIDYVLDNGNVDVTVGCVNLGGSPLAVSAAWKWWGMYSKWSRGWVCNPGTSSHTIMAPGLADDEKQPAPPLDDAWSETVKENCSGQRKTFTAQELHILLAPVARFSFVGLHVDLRNTTHSDDSNCIDSVYTMRAEEARLSSLCVPRTHAAAGAALLMRVASPSVKVGMSEDAGTTFSCQAPLVSLYNYDRHSWALCTQYCSSFVRNVFRNTFSNVYTDVGILERAAVEEGDCGSGGEEACSFSSVKVSIDEAEMCCFLPFAVGKDGAAPEVCIVGQRVDFHYALEGESAPRQIRPGAHHLSASATLSASRCTTSREAEDSLLSKMVVTLSLFSSVTPKLCEERLSLELTATGAEQDTIRLQIPAEDELNRLVTALLFLVAQRVPLRYGKLVRTPQVRLTSNQANDGMRLWQVQLSVPHLEVWSVCPLSTMYDAHAELFTLFHLDVIGFRVNVKTHRPPSRSSIEGRVTSVTGEAFLGDHPDPSLAHKPASPVSFFALGPETTLKTDSRYEVGPAESLGRSTVGDVAGFYMHQESLSTVAAQNKQAGSTRRLPSSDDGTFTLIRVPFLQFHPSFELLKQLTERVLQPILKGIRSVLDDSTGGDMLKLMEATVLHVRQPSNWLPLREDKEFERGQLRIIEVETDWNLQEDIRLGGEDGFQLRFKNTAKRSVITVRGSDARGGREVKLFLGFPVSLNGELCPAITVDADLTVRFVNVVVVETAMGRLDAWCGVSDAYVELGERSLCLLPPLRPRANDPVLAAVSCKAETVVEKVHNPAPSSSWTFSTFHSVDASLGFDISLTEGIQALAAAGCVQARYRREESRASPRELCCKDKGECVLVLEKCESDVLPLTATPLSTMVQIEKLDEASLWKIRMHTGVTSWRLPIGLARLLVKVSTVLRHCFQHLPTSSHVSHGTWGYVASTRPSAGSSISEVLPLDVSVEVPSCLWTLTTDIGVPIAQLHLSELRLQCCMDAQLSDITMTAMGKISLRDRIESAFDAGPSEARKGDFLLRSGAERLLFAAQPSASLTYTRFGGESRLLSLSLHFGAIEATAPLVTIARLIRSAEATTGTHGLVFVNETGVALEVRDTALGAEAGAPGLGGAVWQLAAESGHLVRTRIPYSRTSVAVTLSHPSADASQDASVAAIINLADIDDGASCRVSLAGYTSSLGALDVVVHKIIVDETAVLQLATSVVLANAFFAEDSEGAAASTSASFLRVPSGKNPSLVAPRSAGYLSLPALQDSLTLELGGGLYRAPAKMLTWAMMADAMTLCADNDGDSKDFENHSDAQSSRWTVTDPTGVSGKVDADGRGDSGLDCGVRASSGSTLVFPVLLLTPRHLSAVDAAEHPSLINIADTSDDAAPPAANIVGRHNSQSLPSCYRERVTKGRVVQLVWRRLRVPQGSSLFSGELPRCTYVVTVEPVWTLWNWSGCPMRLRLSLAGSEVVCEGQKSREMAASEWPSTENHRIIATADVKNGTCFQWTPTALDVMRQEVLVLFQLLTPPEDGPSGPTGFSPATSNVRCTTATPFSVHKKPPLYVPLRGNHPGICASVRVEPFGRSSVVVRCAALLSSSLTRSVYLRDAAQPLPLLGAGLHGCLAPQQRIPLFFNRQNTTGSEARHDLPGFTVSPSRVRSTRDARRGGAPFREETNPFFVTTPVVRTLLAADADEYCTRFYAVSEEKTLSRDDEAGSVFGGEDGISRAPLRCRPALTSFAVPLPPTTLVIRSLCRVRNADSGRTLFVMPFRGDRKPEERAIDTASVVTAISPNTEGEVLCFCPHAEEPELHFGYSECGRRIPAHRWSPPVRVLSLTTATLPLVLKHTCLRVRGGTGKIPSDAMEDAAPARWQRSYQEDVVTPTQVDYFRCMTLQATTADDALVVTVALQLTPPLRVVNRLSTTLQFVECAFKSGVASVLSPTAPGIMRTSLSSNPYRPRVNSVEAESSCYSCWEVPTLDIQGLRLMLHSNVRAGVTATLDVDLLHSATTPSSGTRLGNTNAYVYVDLDHGKKQYTVTVAPSRQLEGRLLFQPRRLTQVEVYVRSCTVYVASATLPTAGPFASKSLIACEGRGRLRLQRRRGHRRIGGDRETIPAGATDEDLFTFLRDQELDVVLVRILGLYGSATMTERNVVGSVSLGLLEVADCTTMNPLYAVLIRMGAQVDGAAFSAAEPTMAQSSDALGDGASPVAQHEVQEEEVPFATGSLPTAVHSRDASCFCMDVQFIRPQHVGLAEGFTVIPVQHLRVTVPPVAVSVHDDFLFTLRATVERLGEECDDDSHRAVSVSKRKKLCTRNMRSSNVFLYLLQVSTISVSVTYTRSGHRHYDPFAGLPHMLKNLIPSVEGLNLTFKQVNLRNTEMTVGNSLAKELLCFLWPIYRTQLLLQSYKVLGSLDMLGNPRYLLGSWSRGVWGLLKSSPHKNRWAEARNFLRATTSSTLHSVGVLARSIGNMAGTSPLVSTTNLPSERTRSLRQGSGGPSSPQQSGVVNEVLREVGGGVVEVVTKPIRGARERGVSGFFVGVASGVVGLVGRPVFGLFRGVGATSEFYARLLGGEGELTEGEARRLGPRRNYVLIFSDCPDATSLEKGSGKRNNVASTMLPPSIPRVSLDSGPPILTLIAYEEYFGDLSRWRRSDETGVRLAVERVGLRNTALRLPFAALSTFLSPTEFAEALPYALTVLLANKLKRKLARQDASSPSGGAHQLGGLTGGGEEDAAPGCTEGSVTPPLNPDERASHIKESLGVAALHIHVTNEVFVRVCSLEEVRASLTASEIQQTYALLLAKMIGTAADKMLSPLS